MAIPPWERTGSTPLERVTELVERCEETGRRVYASVEGDRLDSTGGAMYCTPVTDIRAVLDELAELRAHACECVDAAAAWRDGPGWKPIPRQRGTT